MANLIQSLAPFANEIVTNMVGNFLNVTTVQHRDGTYDVRVQDGGTGTYVGTYHAETLPHALRLHADALDGAVHYVAAGGSPASEMAMTMFFRDFETMVAHPDPTGDLAAEHPCGDYPAPCNCDDPTTHNGH